MRDLLLGVYSFEATKKILVYVHDTDYAGFVRSGYTHMGKGAFEGGHIQGPTKPWVQFCVTQLCQVPLVR